MAALAIVVAVLASACGMDGSDQATNQDSTSATKDQAPATAAFARLDPSTFADRMKNEDAVVINVHIPYEGELAETDAFIPFDKIVGDPRLPQKKDREILLYCRSGNMSEEAGAALNAAGYTKVAHLEGGMKAWEASGHQLIHDPAHAAEDKAHKM